MILVAENFAEIELVAPQTGAKSFSVSPVDAIRHALLPGIAICGLRDGPRVARQLRGLACWEVLSSQYVRTLHAQGPVDVRASSGSTA